METEISKHLYDVQQAGLLIGQFINGQTLSSYQSNPMLQSAVERQFITIGEALNQILRLAPDLEKQI